MKETKSTDCCEKYQEKGTGMFELDLTGEANPVRRILFRKLDQPKGSFTMHIFLEDGQRWNLFVPNVCKEKIMEEVFTE